MLGLGLGLGIGLGAGLDGARLPKNQKGSNEVLDLVKPRREVWPIDVPSRDPERTTPTERLGKRNGPTHHIYRGR